MIGRRTAGWWLACLVLAGTLRPAGAASETGRVVELWPEGVPGWKTHLPEERVTNGRIFCVQQPTLTIYAPRTNSSGGTVVIFCPGGGYSHLTVGTNGGPDGQWLLGQGITVCVLKYRMQEYGHPAPLQDVLRAVRTVRSRAEELGVATNRIGVMGASAGGHVAGCAATLFDAPEGRTGAALDAVSARPDFAILIYPVVTMEEPWAHEGSRTGLLGTRPSRKLKARLSLEKQVRKDMPPVFLAATMADKTVPAENSLLLYEALYRAGVPAEMHVYAQGNHGDSRDPQYGPTARWPERCEEWLRFNGWLGEKASFKQ